MKFNIIEKIIFVCLIVFFLILVMPLIKSQPNGAEFYILMFELPFLIIIGVYIIIKYLLYSGNQSPKTKVHTFKAKPKQALENTVQAPSKSLYEELLPDEDEQLKNHKTPLDVFATCGYFLLILAVAQIFLNNFMNKLFILGLIFVPALFGIWIAVFLLAVYPIGFWLFSSSKNMPNHTLIKTSYTEREAWGVISYILGIIVFISGLVYMFQH